MGCINSKNLEDPTGTGTAAPIPPQSPAAANNTNNESPYLNQASIYAEPIEAQVVVDDTNKKKKKKGGGGIFSYPGAKQQVKQPYTPNQSEFNNFVNTTGGGNSPLLVDNPVVTKHFVKAPGGGNALVLVDDNSAPSSSPPVQCFDTINNPLSSYSSPLPSSSYQQLPPPSQTTGSTFIEGKFCMHKIYNITWYIL